MTAVIDTATLESWGQYAEASDPCWDWEAARVDGKLLRFGYCGNRVLVLVVTLPPPRESGAEKSSH